MMQKRTALKLVLAGAAAAMLAGCGDKTEAPKEAAAYGTLSRRGQSGQKACP